MAKHRTMTRFVAVALLGVAATAATMRSHSSRIDCNVVSGSTTTERKFDAREVLPQSAYLVKMVMEELGRHLA
jgi:hypothetical protein